MEGEGRGIQDETREDELRVENGGRKAKNNEKRHGGSRMDER